MYDKTKMTEMLQRKKFAKLTTKQLQKKQLTSMIFQEHNMDTKIINQNIV